MSHFITLLENALKSGEANDPVFREGVYKGALRAFDKISDNRADRAEFRKLHGPQLAQAITRIEQKYVSLKDEPQSHAVENLDGVDLSMDRYGADLDQGVGNSNQNFSHPDSGSVEPAMAEFADDELDFGGEVRPGKKPASNSVFNRTLIWTGLAATILLLAVLIWMFI